VSGNALGYLPLAVVAAAATVLLWMFLSETKPHVYEE
jgi:ABC-type Co2+ transport system permease subunit